VALSALGMKSSHNASLRSTLPGIQLVACPQCAPWQTTVAKSPGVNVLSCNNRFFTDSAYRRGRVYPWKIARTRINSFPAVQA